MMITVIPATADHVLPVARDMRKEDVAEVRASSGLGPEVALRYSLAVSTRAWAMLDHDGTPMGLFGVAPFPGVAHAGTPWLLATPALEGRSREFLRQCRGFIAEMAALYPVLFNHIDVRNRASIRWLRWCGFRLADFDPEYGVERRPFYLFTYLQG